MKKLVIIKNLDSISKLDNIDGYIVGLKDFSVGVNLYLDINEIVNLLKKTDKEIFVAVNKNIRNRDLTKLKENLDILNNINIKGILYYDTAVYMLSIDKNKLVLNKEHSLTNYATINYWNKKGIDSFYLSSEITLKEIEEIKNNTKTKLFVNVFGYLPIFLSKRNLITNYKKNFTIDDSSDIYYMEKEGKKYPLLETYDGTIVYSSMILSAYDDYDKIDKLVDYAVFNSFIIDEDTFIEAVEVFDKRLGKDRLDMLLNYNTDTAFLHKETIYKVKD